MKKCRLFVLLACLCLLLASCTAPAGESPSPAETESPADTDSPALEVSNDTVAFTVGGEPVSIMELNFQFDVTVDAFFQSGAYLEYGVDPETPLSEQQYPDLELSWEDMFYQQAQDQICRYFALYQEGKLAGRETGDREREQIKNVMDQQEAIAQQMDLSLEEMLDQYYGPEMTPERLNQYLEKYVLGLVYEGDLQSELTFTDQELEAYYEENKATVVIPEGNAVSVRHIQMTNTQSVLDVLEKFESGDKSEESFIELVRLYTEDKESLETDGLYTDLLPQNAEENYADFEKWSFDAARQPGDYTLLPAENGGDIVYFVEKTDPFWKVWSHSAMVEDYIVAIQEKYEYVAM